MLRPAALLLTLFSLACSAVPQSFSPNNDDRDVIQTAMLSFFTNEEWHAADWTPKKHVVLRPTFTSKERQPFATALKEAKKRAQEVLRYFEKLPKAKLDAEQQARWKREIHRTESDLIALVDIEKHMLEGSAYAPEPIKQPKYLNWDKRIIVTDKSSRFMFRDDKNSDKSLERWTVYAYPDPPTYSENGRYALLNLSIPWSIHSCNIMFFFERQKGKWVRKLVQSQFYV